jgi:hypothetical protein
MKNAYIELSRGRLQFIIQGVHICAILLGVYDSCYESANVELGFNELENLAKRLLNL